MRWTKAAIPTDVRRVTGDAREPDCKAIATSDQPYGPITQTAAEALRTPCARGAAAAMLVAAVACSGCSVPKAPPQPVSPPAVSHAAATTQAAPALPVGADGAAAAADLVFQDAIFLKPADGALPDEAARLAPLLVLEAPHDSAPDDWPRIGRVDRDKGRARLQATPPTVYWAASTARVGGREYSQLVFLWFFAMPRSTESTPWQAIRITTGHDGFPIVWEALGPGESTQRLFVAKSLEARATAEHGPPLTGRRYSIERSRDEAPHVVVSRVIADGPMPMGPIVFVRAADRSINAVICRCMPSQFNNAVENDFYHAAPFDALAPMSNRASNAPDGTPAIRAFFGSESAQHAPDWLEHALRFPAEF